MKRKRYYLGEITSGDNVSISHGGAGEAAGVDHYSPHPGKTWVIYAVEDEDG
jgi:hypothetical protein